MIVFQVPFQCDPIDRKGHRGSSRFGCFPNGTRSLAVFQALVPASNDLEPWVLTIVSRQAFQLALPTVSLPASTPTANYDQLQWRKGSKSEATARHHHPQSPQRCPILPLRYHRHLDRSMHGAPQPHPSPRNAPIATHLC